MIKYETLLENTLKLNPNDRAQLVKEILKSLDSPNAEIDMAWEEEAVKRYRAYQEKRLHVKDLNDVLKRYVT